MKGVVFALALVLMFATQAFSQATQICYQMGEWRMAYFGTWDVVGTFNSRGQGSGHIPGNVYTAEIFDYDVCTKNYGVPACHFLYQRAINSFNSTLSLDCNNTQGEWTNNYGGYETWYQGNKSVGVYGYLYTDHTNVPCGIYSFFGNINGDGVTDVFYRHVGATPSHCHYSFTYRGVTYGQSGSGRWTNSQGSGQYAVYRKSPLPGNQWGKLWSPIREPASAKKPWRQ